MNFSNNQGTVWVTGAGGFIGLHLSRELAATGNRVIGFGLRPSSEFDEISNGAFVQGGVSAANLQTALTKYGSPATVFHLAGGATVANSISRPFEDFEKNVFSTACLLEFLRLYTPATPLVIASSAAVYGDGHDGAIEVTAALRPNSPYGQNKRIVEQMCQSYSLCYGLPISVVRLFSVYGPNLRKQLLFDLCCKLADNPAHLELGGSGDEIRDWCHISDVISFLRHAVPNLRNQFTIHNGGTGIGTSVKSVAQHLIAIWGSNSSIRFNGKKRMGDPFSLVAGRSDITSEFKWRVELGSGLEAYVEWFKRDLRKF